jgi:DNA-binding beta-propeller fold protein YncE
MAACGYLTSLKLTTLIPLENVHGRIDHFGFDRNNRLFVSALGNNTAEIVDVSAQRVVHTIAGVPTPQGVVYSPETNKLFVASAKGKLYIYAGSSYDLLITIDFAGDADNLRYDPAEKRVYVGYGDDETAAIGMVDATTNQPSGPRVQDWSTLGILSTGNGRVKHLCESP